MGVKGHDSRDIFPDFKTHVFPPVSAAWFQPKQWNTDGLWAETTAFLTSFNSTFQANNVQIGDSISLLDGEPATTTVALVFTETLIKVNVTPTATHNNVRFKVGHGEPHTLQTLASIVAARDLTFYTIHHRKLWTGVQMRQWNTDHTGEVYVISHDIQKARWLDGEITLPVGFPDEPKRPSEDLPISAWETRFPGQPRPDYPSGLEPTGPARLDLIAAHGSLLAAEEAYLEVS